MTKRRHCQLSLAPTPMEKSPPTLSLHLDYVKILLTKSSKLSVVSSPPFLSLFS